MKASIGSLTLHAAAVFLVAMACRMLECVFVIFYFPMISEGERFGSVPQPCCTHLAAHVSNPVLKLGLFRTNWMHLLRGTNGVVCFHFSTC